MLRLRILLAWLLMATLPMQGFAAASMLFCGGNMQHAHAAASGEPAAHPQHAGMDHDHATMLKQFAKADPAPSDSAGHKCSICATCCNGMALQGLTPLPLLAPAPQSALAEPVVLIQARPSPVPDKPPRA